MLFADGPGRRLKSDVSGLLGAFLIVGALYFAREVLIPLALAGLITFLLAPLATRLERWGFPRTMSGLLVIGLTAAGVCATGWVVLGQVYNLAVELPQYQQNITQKVNTLHLNSAGKLSSTVQMLTEVSKQIASGSTETGIAPLAAEPIRRRGKTAVAKPPQASLTPGPEGPVTVRIEEPRTSLATVAALQIHPLISPLTTTFVVVIFVIFMLLARDDIRDRAVLLIGSNRIHVTTVAMSDAGSRVSRYLLMQFVVNLGYGIVVGFALWGIGVPHPLLWAVTTFLLRFVPYVGILAAGTGPVLIALAVSPNWSTVAWTFGLYVALELLAANAVEPMLYGSSTGVSALAILIAAIFWTWLWGIAGLLLSTPLTVCLIVVGRHVPRLEFLGVLFGEKTVLDPPERLYQRILASDAKDAAKLIEDEFKIHSREAVYDKVLIPALSLMEEARHAEQLDPERAEQALQRIEELVEEHWTAPESTSQDSERDEIICVAVKDLADDIACQLLMHVLSPIYRVRVIAADLLSANVIEIIEARRPKIICVVGIPPQAVRHVRVRCHQLRTRFPDMIIVACVPSVACDLSNVRSRIPLEDAQHVVCSLQQAQEYLASLAAPVTRDGLAPVVTSPSEVRELQPLDETKVDIFDQIVTSAAKALDAPIALISIREGGSDFWRAQCGLPEDEKNTPSALRHSSICADVILDGKCMIIPDTAEDPRFSDDPILMEKGIRFFAGLPIVGQDGREIGSLCVFDTRPRQITDQQRESLTSLSTSVTKAIELQPAAEGAPSSSGQVIRTTVDRRQSRTAQLLSEVREEG